MGRYRKELSLLVIIFSFLISCSLNKLAVDILADTLAAGGGGTVFTGDDDPELIGDALPFALKMYELLLEQSPDNEKLLLTTGSGFIMYANVYVQTPADMLSEIEFKKQAELRRRAKRLYLRGRDYVLEALELRHPGFTALVEEDRMAEALKSTIQEDVPYLYWAGAGWAGAFSTDTFDMELLLTVSRAIAMMKRALEMDEEFMDGTIHEFFISYYGSVPESMGGGEEKARYHFQKALEISGGLKASPYIALATSVSVRNQDAGEFKDLLTEALAIDPDSSVENRLVNILSRRKAEWLLEHVSDYFLLEPGSEENLEDF